jgi:hypothetical protein
LRSRLGRHRREAERFKYIASDKPSPHWVKIKNANYSQAEGREVRGLGIDNRIKPATMNSNSHEA